MWAQDPLYYGIKSKRGEPINDRITAGTAIASAAHNRRSERGLYSLAISLLPFFKPSKTSRESLENPDALISGNDVNQYLNLLEHEPIFAILAYFCIVTRYRVGIRTRGTISKLAEEFRNRGEPIQVATSGAVADMTAALERFRPKVWNVNTQNHVSVPSIDARELAPHIVNAILVHHALRMNEDFKVHPIRGYPI